MPLCRNYIIFSVLLFSINLENKVNNNLEKNNSRNRKSINLLQSELLDLVTEIFSLCHKGFLKNKSNENKVIIDGKIYNSLCNGMTWIEKNVEILDDPSAFSREHLEIEIKIGKEILKSINNDVFSN